MTPKADDFHIGLRRILETYPRTKDSLGEFVDIVALDLQKNVGYDPKDSRFPICCNVMRDSMQPGDVVLHQPKQKKSSTLTIRYRFPRRL